MYIISRKDLKFNFGGKMSLPKFRSTTVIAVKKDGKVAMAGDGQVTMGETVMKGNARKVRRIFDGKEYRWYLSIYNRFVIWQR